MNKTTSAAAAAGAYTNTFAFDPASPPPGGHPSLRRTMLAGLRRPADPDSWAAISSFARLVTTPDGKPIRSIITGRRCIVTGSYASRKARRALVHESMNERALFVHSEVDTEIIDYQSQPLRLEFVLDGRRRTYIADCLRQKFDGSLELVEVKHDQRALRDPDYALKIQAVAKVCQALQWSFRVVHGAPLRAKSTFNTNVGIVQQYRFVKFGAREIHLAGEALAQAGGEIAFGRLAEILGERRIGRAQICAMMVGRIVRIDLQSALNDNSVVRSPGSSLTSSEARA
ncbi:TnsA endonuclease N-terminal domain-containing protein [Caulobacter sp. AP07]|uniref:TnsA endonuclease N-terminal domain-containing protein n=1 Tax=Caulobacter sp. AP07 TaxID=1144304 RepID=UPI0012FA57D2|nr:TnsA endonuclease N-terminal domain-containing protein [Caulobacter sp. AP07]